MKYAALFLVLSMVVLMAQPGDAFLHHIWNGIVHVGKKIGSIFGRQQQEQLAAQRAYDQDQVAFR